MQGSLTPDSLARAMRGLSLGRKEGVLHLSKDGMCRRIYFREGDIIFADTDNEEEQSEDVLICKEKSQRSNVDIALKVRKDMCPADRVSHALERTKSIIHSAFCWPSGTFDFEERSTDVDDDVALKLSTTQMILEAACSIDDLEVARRGLGDLRAVLRQPTNPSLPYDGSASSSVEWLLYQANGFSTIEEIVAGAPIAEDKALRSIYALVLAGILEIENPGNGKVDRSRGTKANLGVTRTMTVSADFQNAFAHNVMKKIGRYDVDRVIGCGAMGVVYLGRDPNIDRVVAIKLIQATVQLTSSEFEKYRERFYREAKAAGKLLHPGIVTVFDLGHTTEGTPFIVMEYVQGKTLQKLLEAEKLDHEEILRLAVKILDPLAYAHSNGIVHRDIKPANILVTSDGGVKIMDFGIAHVVGSELTEANDVLGSPNYMAPEQLSKGTIDARTDLFALGVLLYRMLTGTLPFRGDCFAAIAKAILFEDPRPPSYLESAIPDHLSSTVLRCLAKEPALRFQTADELKNALSSRVGHDEVPDADMIASRASTSRGSTVWRVGQEPSTKAGDRSPVSLSSMLRELTSVAADWVRSTPKTVRLGLAAAGALAIVFLVAFAASREPATAESVPAQRTTPARDSDTIPRDIDSMPAPAEARLFYGARLAFERGDLEESRRQLDTLHLMNPSFDGASELLVKINDEIWKMGLPMSFYVKHRHRIGSCTGILTLAAWGIQYSSDEHEWKWEFSVIRLLEREGRRILNLEVHENNNTLAKVARVLGLGTPNNYKFELIDPIREEDWTRYQKLLADFHTRGQN